MYIFKIIELLLLLIKMRKLLLGLLMIAARFRAQEDEDLDDEYLDLVEENLDLQQEIKEDITVEEET
jgi:hypothetical protein